MQVGDKVVYYTHQVNDNVHSTLDQLAFVTRVANEFELDLVVFPPGGPVLFIRASEYDEEDLDATLGASYWREDGSEPPDFQAIRFVNDPEWVALRRQQKAELDRTTPANQEAVLERQEAQRSELYARLDKAYPPVEGATA